MKFSFSYQRSQFQADQVEGVPNVESYLSWSLQAPSEKAALIMVKAAILMPGKYEIKLHREGWERIKIFYYVKPPIC